MIATEADLAAVTSRIVSAEPVTAVWLFDSYAKGTPRDDSDVDLLIVGDYRVPPSHRGRHAAATVKRFPLRLDLLFYMPRALAAAARDPPSFAALALRRARLLHGS